MSQLQDQSLVKTNESIRKSITSTAEVPILPIEKVYSSIDRDERSLKGHTSRRGAS